MKRKVLVVDDEQNLLDALQRQLRKRFDLRTACGGPEGLECIEAEGPFDVVVSDMRMPEMDGIQFLERVREVAPDTVRMMLTGNADQMTAVQAINRGAIFRFLNKPVDTEQLAEAIEACGRQHDLIVAEKELLEKTLAGAVRVLVEILSMLHPEGFGRCQQLKERAKLVARMLDAPEPWMIELAALFAQIGIVAVPPELLHKVRRDMPLTDYEKRTLSRTPLLGANILSQIPRLERVAEIIRLQRCSYRPVGDQECPSGEGIPIGSRILRVLGDLADLESRGLDLKRAFFVMRRNAGAYDPRVFEAAEWALCPDALREVGFPVLLEDLSPGMVLTEDLVGANGDLLVAKGATVSETLLERLRNLGFSGTVMVRKQLNPAA